MLNPLHRLCCGWVCVTKDRENLRGIPKYDRKVMVSPHLGKFSQEDVADGRGWTKSIFYSRKKIPTTLQQKFQPPQRECPYSKVPTKKDGSGTKAGGIFVCKLDRLCEYERIRKGRTWGTAKTFLKVRKIRHERECSL